MNKETATWVLGLLLLLTGCLGQRKVTQQYYILEAGAYLSIDSTREEPLPYRCLAQAAEVDKAYSGTRIASRVRSNEIAYFQNHQWAVRPEYYFTQIVTDFLDHRGVFIESTGRILVGRPDVFLTTRVHNLEVVVGERGMSARLNLEFQLTDAYSGIVLASHRADRNKPMEDRSINRFASLAGEMLAEELSVFEKVIRGASWPDNQ